MPKHLLVSVHGIWTLGAWQRALRKMVLDVEPGATTHEYKYSVVSAYSLSAVKRRKKVRQFANELLREFERESWDRIDIVSHSLGTFIVAEALQHLISSDRAARLPRIKTLILAGSVLPRGYDWRELVPRFVARVVNDCGTRDHVLWLPELFLPKLGFGGRVGFNGMTGHDVHNRYFLFGHGGFFSSTRGEYTFMKQWWLPLLTQESECVRDHDARLKRTLPTLVAWLERQVNLFRIAILTSLLVAVVTPLALHVRHLTLLNRRLLAEVWAMQSLQRQATQPIEAKRLAIASAKLHGTPQTQHALMQALAASARPVSVLKLDDRLNLRFAIDERHERLANAGIDSQGRMFVNLYSLKGMVPQLASTWYLPGPRCSQRYQPLRLSFSNTGKYLALEAVYGSCLLEIRTGAWTDLSELERVTFSRDDAVFYASRSSIALDRRPVGPLLSVFGPNGRKAVSGIIDSGWLRDIALVGDTGAIVADARGRTWMVPSNDSTAVQVDFKSEDERAQAVAANDVSKLVAVATEQGTVSVADVKSVKWRVTISASALRLVFSNDGRRLGALLTDGTARIWNAHDGSQRAMFDGAGYPLDIHFLDYDGSRVLTVNREGGIKVWSVATQSLLAQVPTAVAHDAYAFAPSGQIAIVGDDNGLVTLWNTAWRRDEFGLHLEEGIRSILVRGRGKFVAALGVNEQLRMWDSSTGQLLLNIAGSPGGASSWGSSLALSEDGSAVATINRSGLVRVWRPAKGLVFEIKLPRLFADEATQSSRGFLRSLPLGTDSRIVQACSADVPIARAQQASLRIADAEMANRTCRYFDPAKARPYGLMSTDMWIFRAPLALSDDGEFIGLSFLGDILVFEVESGKLSAHHHLGYEERTASFAVPGTPPGPALVNWISFSRDRRHLVAATRSDPLSEVGGNVIRSWPMNMTRDHLTPSLRLGRSHAALRVLPEADSIISLSEKRQRLNMWDMKSLRLKTSLRIGRFVDDVSIPQWEQSSLVVLSHDEATNAPSETQSGYMQVDVFDVRTLRQRAQITLRGPAEIVTLVPDGTSLFVEDGLGTARIVDLETGTMLAEFNLGTKPKSIWFGGNGTLFYASGGQSSYTSILSGENYIGSKVSDTQDTG